MLRWDAQLEEANQQRAELENRSSALKQELDADSGDCGQVFRLIADSDSDRSRTAAPIDGFNGSLGVVGVKLAAFGGFFRWFAQGLAVEGEAVRCVHEAIKDGIGDRWITEHH